MKRTQSGFTLLELIMAVFMFAIIAALIAAFSIYYFGNYSFSFEENQSISQAQTAMTQMVREIREARIGDDGAWPIVTPQDTVFEFYCDVTNDGRSDKVRYFLDGTTLKRGVIQPTTVPVSYPPQNEVISVVTSYVDITSGAIFSYYNGDYPVDKINNPLGVSDRLLNTRYVGIHLVINIQTGNGAEPFELKNGVQIRSLKDNL